MRQAGDKTFAQTLNYIREGLQADSNIKLITSRTIDKNDPTYPFSATHILYYKKSVQKHNKRLYKKATTDKISYSAIDIVIGDVSVKIKDTILEKAHIKQMMLWDHRKYIKLQ